MKARLKDLVDKIREKASSLAILRELTRKSREHRSVAFMDLVSEEVKNDPKGQVERADLQLYEFVKKNEFETSKVLS